ncbi:FHA domain-containing protein [Plectonema cf. radiosum LEGE 06105]|uniref:FHA domain-containing protein n=1 Tax=Plectonema cf. radiosum LEGE 06105 TaxID=945769 RepID=A0A8J7FDZ7_9CYAN|nr:FHA domain-containing protein [Plectonema radiosum]MBE9214673.1 FHA domain-containing protein [Plectonema cf. radiosum LEGE 06105]
MIVCPNCNHPNPDGAVQCEACYTPLPATTSCPGCGATVQADAAFCGQCGYNLRSSPSGIEPTVAPESPIEVPPLGNLPNLNPIEASSLPPTAVSSPPGFEPPTTSSEPESGEQEIPTPPPAVTPPPVNVVEAAPATVEEEEEEENSSFFPDLTIEPEPEPEATPAPAPAPIPVTSPSPSRTQLQQVSARLVHVKTDTQIELPQNLSVIHIGKANDRVPPDIDVSGLENSEVVSRIHADIRVEGDAYYIEDVGSSNGTYVNGMSLLPGNRHRLRPGDKVSMGKGDLVSFLFQIS